MGRLIDALLWLLSPSYRRETRAIEEEFRRFDENCRQMAELDKRIAKAFTPEEWRELSERCEARLAPYGQYGEHS